MKLTWVGLAAASLVVAFDVGLAGNTRMNQSGSASTGAKRAVPVIIVELFTSEGCSSCPPADLLLKKLSEEQPIEGAQVVALEEHVDYWNRLGWRDPFSSAEFSRRQEEYAGVFGNNGVYTPQMIVDGQTEFTGSQARKAREAIERSAGMPKVNVEISSAAKETGVDSFDVRVMNAPAQSKQGKHELELWLAVTEKGLQSDVKAGENSGETLKHAAVVRSLRKIEDVRGDGVFEKQVSVNLKKDWKREQMSVVAFVVAKGSRKIVGGAILPVARWN
jgi:hypothetical protein